MITQSILAIPLMICLGLSAQAGLSDGPSVYGLMLTIGSQSQIMRMPNLMTLGECRYTMESLKRNVPSEWTYTCVTGNPPFQPKAASGY
jgi:hypothetical protein